MKLKITKTFISDNYFITLNKNTDDDYTDKDIAETLNIPYNDYIQILKTNNAYLRHSEYFFEFKEDALKALEKLESILIIN